MNEWKEKAIKHFDNEHLCKETNKEAGMWPSKSSQIVRFDALMRIGNLNDCKILDVGCGLGDFYFYLQENNIKIKNYIGVEIHPEIVKLANSKHKELSIELMDILDNNYPDDFFDFSISSGLFNFVLNDWSERTKTILTELYRISKVGVSVNFLRWRSEGLNPASAYVKIDELYEIITSITNNFVIRGDCKKNDFTVYIYKNQLT